ncbi:MAG: methyltransferase domain-containing protein [Acidimicrobiales bacterium]
MQQRTSRAMRAFWDEGARRNAAWYVDTTLAYDEPDMAKFFESGEEIVEQLVDRAPVEPAHRQLAVEVGSGLGRVCLALSSRFERVIGVDIAPEMVQRARQLVVMEGVTFQVGDGLGLGDIDDASTDLVLSFTVFQHIPSAAIVRGYLEEAARVLRPGGVLVFQWNNLPGPRRWAIRRAALGLLQRSGLRPEHYRRHAPEFLGSRIPIAPIQRALERNGLQLVGTSGLGTLFAWASAVRQA